MERVLLPVSSLAGWGLVTVGGLMVLHVLGINIGPLLALGGFGTVALGIGAQAITSNAISGLNLVRCLNQSSQCQRSHALCTSLPKGI